MNNLFPVGLLLGLLICLCAMVFGLWLVKALLATCVLLISATVLNAVVTRLARI